MTIATRICMKAVFAGIVVAGLLAVGGKAEAQDRDFFNDGVGLFDPVIDVVWSGAQLVTAPTVSADRKYVTISGRFENTQLQRIENFQFFGTSGVGGNVGNAQPAPAIGDEQARATIRATSPAIRPMPARGVLNQPGMTKLRFD